MLVQQYVRVSRRCLGKAMSHVSAD